MKKLILYLEKVFGDDLGRGKNPTARHRYRHIIKVRMRRYFKSLQNEQL